LIHFASREMNNDFVEGEAIAAVHICQSAGENDQFDVRSKEEKQMYIS
jgi:hypothetical protein